MTERLHFHFSLSCIGEGNGSPLQCSCLENPRDGGAWWAAIYGVTQSQTRLKPLSSSSYGKIHAYELSYCKLSKMRTCTCMSNHMLVHMSGMHCHVCILYKGLCLCILLYCIEYSSMVSLFQAQNVQKQAWKLILSKSTRIWRPRERTKGRNNWRMEEIHNSGNGEGIFFTWGVTVRFEAQDLNVEQTWSLQQLFSM